MKAVEYSPAALEDLREINFYIATDDPHRADRFVEELIATANKIGERPGSFPKSEDVGPELRRAVHGRYGLYFRELPNGVMIVRVLHSARDLTAIAKAGGFD